MLLLTDEIINSLLSVRDCVGDMELAYQQLAAEQGSRSGTRTNVLGRPQDGELSTGSAVSVAPYRL
jgi:hypothetical protein